VADDNTAALVFVEAVWSEGGKGRHDKPFIHTVAASVDGGGAIIAPPPAPLYAARDRFHTLEVIQSSG
jgi:hypothetical protein